MNKVTRHPLIKAFSGSALIKITSLGLGFLLTLVLARALSPTGYGAYSYVLALITLAAVPAQMGVPEVVVRETAKFHLDENWSALKGLWRWSLLAVLTAATVAVTISYICYLSYEPIARTEYISIVFWSFFLLPLMALASLRGAMLSGLRRVLIGQLPDNILRPACLIILVIFTLLSGAEISPDKVMFYHVIAAAAAFLIGAFLLFKLAPIEIRRSRISGSDSSNWTKSAFPLALISGMYIVNQQLDILFLGWLGSAEDIGIYKVVSQMGMFVIFGQQMVRGVMSPEISRYWAKNNLEDLEQLVRYSGKISFCIALFVCAVFFLGGRQLLGLLFGSEYAVGFLAMVILCIGQLINASFGSVGNILSMTGNANSSLMALSVSMIINCLLNMVLIPIWGLEGAACATTISMVIWNFLLWRVVRKKINIRPTIFRI